MDDAGWKGWKEGGRARLGETVVGRDRVWERERGGRDGVWMMGWWDGVRVRREECMYVLTM